MAAVLRKAEALSILCPLGVHSSGDIYMTIESSATTMSHLEHISRFDADSWWKVSPSPHVPMYHLGGVSSREVS
jgi:cation transporter-like permease